MSTRPGQLQSDDRFAVLPLQREAGTTQATIVVHPSALLDALGNLFEGLWRRAFPLDLPTTDAAPSQRDRSTADDQRLTALLLSGLTDEAIARQLGVSYRTAQRRIAALIGASRRTHAVPSRRPSRSPRRQKLNHLM
jgi:DNA-binding CsgD family transcriptional regulator